MTRVMFGPSCCEAGMAAIDWVRSGKRKLPEKPKPPSHTGWAICLYDGGISGVYRNVARCPWCGAMLENFKPEA